MNYDVIIIGNTPAGRYAAYTAALWEARVALVTQNISFSSEADWFYDLTLTQLTQIAQQWENIQPTASPPLETYQQWAQEVIEVMEEETALVKLAAKGIDVIDGKGEFCRLPQQAFIVNHEKLQARAYILATETSSIIPQVPDLLEIGYLTLSEIREKKNLETLPQNITIIGQSPTAISLAQTLAKLKKNITLSLVEPQLLPTEDREITYLLQAQLEADGIDILTASPLLQIRTIYGHKWLQLGKYAIETEELILFPESRPNVEDLNLEGVRVDHTKQGLVLNEKLQTTNRKIYGCGCIAGGYPFFNIAQHEAEIALKNALFFPGSTVHYQSIPWVISTSPPLARVGMTEAQAKRRYGEKILIIKENFKSNLISLIQGETTGLLKLVLRHNGEILGGHIIGNHAEELVNVIAIALSRKLKIKQLAAIYFPSPTVSQLLMNAVQKWEKYYYQNRPVLRELRKRYFLFCRHWTKH